MKKILIILYLVVVAVLAAATIVEKYLGTPYVADRIYGAWWFSLLWACLAAVAVAWIIRSKMRRWYLIMLHVSFVVILAGALLSHLTSWQGMLHLRTGETVREYTTSEGTARAMPFALRLNSFQVKYHEGTAAPADYESHITVFDGDIPLEATVSMNNIFSYRNIRLYQTSFDKDSQGTYLTVNADPWGIPVTYAGYALLFFALIWMLIAPDGTFRRLLHSPLLKNGALSLFLLFSFSHAVSAAPRVLPQETARRFCELNVLYNDRICPLQTYALDFTKKIYGSRHYGNYSAEQVLTGFIFFPDDWYQEPVLKIKGDELKSALRLPGYVSVNRLITPQGYLLAPLVQEYYGGTHNDLQRQAYNVDDRLMIIMELRGRQPLKLFPHTAASGLTTWYSPVDPLPLGVEEEHRKYMGQVLDWLQRDINAGNMQHVNEGISRMHDYQVRFGAGSLPSSLSHKAELFYNRIPFATILFMLNLTMGFITLALFIRKLSARRKERQSDLPANIAYGVMVLAFLALTLCESLRWIISGTIPMSNGYETMLFTAWLVMLITLIGYRRFHILLTFGFFLSGFFLLVSHISQMDPKIGHVMPVLNSPLLTVHVSIIMMSYALISLTFICGLTALFLRGQRESLAALSRLFLYPALTTMGLGIFIGAIWANISWGSYWSWDPKETWALITFMIYAVVVHTQTLPVFRQPLAYHIYMVLAFLSLLMTYFGVNYFLGGMHSYA